MPIQWREKRRKPGATNPTGQFVATTPKGTELWVGKILGVEGYSCLVEPVICQSYDTIEEAKLGAVTLAEFAESFENNERTKKTSQ